MLNLKIILLLISLLNNPIQFKNQQPHIINPALLWEYDLTTLNYKKSYKIVIERVLQLGNLQEWRNMVNYYSTQQILDTIEWSAQLEERGKKFSKFF